MIKWIEQCQATTVGLEKNAKKKWQPNVEWNLANNSSVNSQYIGKKWPSQPR